MQDNGQVEKPAVDKSAVRDAATVILVRDRHSDPSVLMGQRGAKAAFMPNKFVFPGGAVDAADRLIRLASPLSDLCRDRLADEAPEGLATALAVAGALMLVLSPRWLLLVRNCSCCYRAGCC